MVQDLSLRERKKASTRENILQAAARLFEVRGFDAVTMDDIARAADVSRSTLFRYFGSKEALVFPHQQERLERFRHILGTPAPGETPFETASRALLELAVVFWRARAELRRQQRIVKSSPWLQACELLWYDKWSAALGSALEKQAGRDEKLRDQARVLAAAVFGVVRAEMIDWLRGGCKNNLPRLARRRLEQLSAGARTMAPALWGEKLGGGACSFPKKG